MITFDPSSYLAKKAPKSKIKKAITKNLTLKKAAFNFVDKIDVLDKQIVTEVALKTLKSYKQRVADDPSLKDELANNPAQLVQRVQNLVILEVHDKIKEVYRGERAVWLPSDADEPRPEHQLLYGQEYIIGEGIDGVEPGDEYGCRCGVQILTDDTQLKLGE